MKSLLALVVLTLLTRSSIAQAQTPFERIEQAYASYMEAGDPLAFPMKVKSLAKDPYTFWRGSKDLFYHWCKENAVDWLADRPAFLANHGDLHLGNIGTYAADGRFGHLAFGMVDFDDSGRLPFQFELLQGLITLRLTAEQNAIALTADQEAELASALFESYRIAINSRRNATDLLADDPLVTELLAKGAGRAYSEELDDYVGPDGTFTKVIRGQANAPKEILRPADDRADAFSAAIVQALANSPEMASLFRFSTPGEVRRAVKAIVQRTRLGSSGSQGLKKYFVLLDQPLHASDSPIILYLKQEIPSAAERQGLIPRDPRSPGQRCAEDMNRLTEPRPYLNSWCEVSGESYWVHFKEPWSDELNPGEVTDDAKLMHAARIWGTVAGATHREEGRFEMILPRLTPDLLAQIRLRTDAYLAQLRQDFAAFQSDPQVRSRVQQADNAISRLSRTR